MLHRLARSTGAEFVVFAPSFHAASGGAVVLHLLCEKLRENGFSARMWPETKPLLSAPNGHKMRGLISTTTQSYMRDFSTGPWHPRIASHADLSRAVIVYPEVIDRNPLKARHVARWLLHKEGFFHPERQSGTNDLLFFYNPAFMSDAEGRLVGGQLSLTYIPVEYAVLDASFPEPGRSETCFLQRKSEGQRPMHPDGAIRIDGMSHARTAETMAQSRYLYSYDPYTMYNYFAAMRGCVPIVAPISGLSEEEWQPDVSLRWGLAYGTDRIQWAIMTRPLLLERIREVQSSNDNAVRQFAEACRAHFATSPKVRDPR